MSYESCYIPPDVNAAIRVAVGIPAHVRIELHIAPEDIPVRGNASAWGEPEDSEHATAIENRLADGELWAWCIVRVTCTDGDVKGTAWLGAANYENTEDFIKYGYLQDMVIEAYQEYWVADRRLPAMNTDTQPAAAATSTRCFHCGLPVEEPERRVISCARGFYAHLTPSRCAIATIQARETARVTT